MDKPIKIKTGNGMFLLAALVQSQQEKPTKNEGIKFVPYEPIKRKKRTYKK